MSFELKDDEGYLIFYYRIPESDPPASFMGNESRDYTEWLKRETSGYHTRLLNVIRHPDMSKNVLIHYFAVLKEVMEG